MGDVIDIRRMLTQRSRNDGTDYTPMANALVAVALALATIENLTGDEFADVIELAMHVEDREGIDEATVAVLVELGVWQPRE